MLLKTLFQNLKIAESVSKNIRQFYSFWIRVPTIYIEILFFSNTKQKQISTSKWSNIIEMKNKFYTNNESY